MNNSIKDRISRLEAIARKKREEEQALYMRLSSEIESEGSEEIMSSVASVREEIRNLQEAIDIAQGKLKDQEKLESSKEYQVQLKKLNEMNKERKIVRIEIIHQAEDLLKELEKYRERCIQYDVMKRKISSEPVLIPAFMSGADGWIMKLHKLLKSWLNDKKWIEKRLA